MAKLKLIPGQVMSQALIVDRGGNPDHSDIPESIDGHVILKVDDSGNIHTCTYEMAQYFKTLDQETKDIAGWGEFQGILDSLPPAKPSHAAADPAIDKFKGNMVAAIAKRKEGGGPPDNPGNPN